MPRTGLYLQQMGFQTSFEMDPCPTFHSDGSEFKKFSYLFLNYLNFLPQIWSDLGSGSRIFCVSGFQKSYTFPQSAPNLIENLAQRERKRERAVYKKMFKVAWHPESTSDPDFLLKLGLCKFRRNFEQFSQQQHSNFPYIFARQFVEHFWVVTRSLALEIHSIFCFKIPGFEPRTILHLSRSED